MRTKRFAAAAALAGLMIASAPAVAQMPTMAPYPPVKDDGAITTPSFELPFSSFASPEARASFVKRIREPMTMVPDIAKMRASTDERMTPFLTTMKRVYPYTATRSKIGGVPVDTIVPTAGIAPANKNKVLIELHGGAFVAGGGGIGGQIEAVPIASVGRIKVIAVDYRMAPEHRFPAASEDVAAVYRELLKTYKPENIGIFGCSAGGMLAAQSISWFLKEGLPLPGAIGVFCATLYTFAEGDSPQLWSRMGSVLRMVPPAKVDPSSFGRSLPYFAGASATDPLAVPGASEDILKQFPPTLLLTGSRAPEASGAAQSHIRLRDLGVESDLFLFDGLDHGFFSEPDLPESKTAYRLITQFFAEHLGKPRSKTAAAKR